MAIGGVAACVGEVIAAHTVMLLAMADDRLNGGTPFELALDRRREAALLEVFAIGGLQSGYLQQN